MQLSELEFMTYGNVISYFQTMYSYEQGIHIYKTYWIGQQVSALQITAR